MSKQPSRQEVDPRYTWQTSSIFPTSEAWEEAFHALEAEAPRLAGYAGKLGESARTLYEFFQLEENLEKRLSHLYVYAHLKADEDTGNSENQGRHARIRQLAAKVAALQAFVRPELLQLGKERIEQLLDEKEELQLYRHAMEDLLRFEAHTLSPKEEALLAAAAPIFHNSSQTFSTLNNADLRFRPIQNKEGENIEVTHSSYGRLMENKDRDIREGAFSSIYEQYRQYAHTFASTLNGTVLTHNFEAQLRGFPSARVAAMYENHIPEEVQQNLIDTVHESLPLLHDYMAMRKEKMGLEKMYTYDLYTSLVSSVKLNFTIEEAMEVVKKALRPLGEAYGRLLQKAFDEHWIDWVDNRGKRSGAYSSGVYGTNPFILMSWQGTLSNLFTLVHELGHSLHSYHTWEKQAFPYANYCIFLAEIASTTNENLLTKYLLETYREEATQTYIINQYIDRVKSTLFRQTQFAEFEHEIHQAQQEGKALTADFLSELYGEINRKYYGPALEDCEEIHYEWARIPHFYYNYYVYQYATGFSAAVAFATAIEKEGQPAVDRYLGFLSSGSSEYPLETLKRAGVDMTSPAPIRTTLKVFGDYLEELKKRL